MKFIRWDGPRRITQGSLSKVLRNGKSASTGSDLDVLFLLWGHSGVDAFGSMGRVITSFYNIVVAGGLGSPPKSEPPGGGSVWNLQYKFPARSTLRHVGRDFVSFASGQAQKLTRFMRPPFPSEPASLGFGWIIPGPRNVFLSRCREISRYIWGVAEFP